MCRSWPHEPHVKVRSYCPKWSDSRSTLKVWGPSRMREFCGRTRDPVHPVFPTPDYCIRRKEPAFTGMDAKGPRKVVRET